MLDQNLNAWLIEVNRSPDMSHSTIKTSKLVPEFFNDLVGMFSEVNWEDIQNISADC